MNGGVDQQPALPLPLLTSLGIVNARQDNWTTSNNSHDSYTEISSLSPPDNISHFDWFETSIPSISRIQALRLDLALSTKHFGCAEGQISQPSLPGPLNLTSRPCSCTNDRGVLSPLCETVRNRLYLLYAIISLDHQRSAFSSEFVILTRSLVDFLLPSSWQVPHRPPAIPRAYYIFFEQGSRLYLDTNSTESRAFPILPSICLVSKVHVEE